MTVIEELIEHIDGEYGCTVFYRTHDAHTHFVDFVAVEIVSPAVMENDRELGRGYQRRGALSSPDIVLDPREAEPYVAGSVKWDGCVNYVVGDRDQPLMMHACGRTDLEKLSRVLVVIFERCGQLMRERGVDVLDGEFADV
jgi:hypothetical protein